MQKQNITITRIRNRPAPNKKLRKKTGFRKFRRKFWDFSENKNGPYRKNIISQMKKCIFYAKSPARTPRGDTRYRD